jgi:hypothetical protein
MKDILDKITPYNLFNYLLPGVLFVVALEQLTKYSLMQENLVIGAFVYYFVGLVVSRFGSLIVEPFLKRISFLKFAPYSDFVAASKLDARIELFSETNNMYRTFVSVFSLLLLFKIYELVAQQISFLNEYALHILVVVLLIGFLFSYRKQTRYVKKRVELNKS